MKDGLKNKIYGICLTGLMLIISAVFVFVLADTKFLATKWILIISALLLFFCALIFALSQNSKKKVLTVIATVIMLICSAVLIAGIYFLSVAKSSLNEIVTPDEEYTDIGVYVRTEDSYQSLPELKEKTFGILGIFSRKEVNVALKKIAAQYGFEPKIKTFSSVEDLADSLLVSKETDCIILSNGFLDLLSDIEGHTEDGAKIRQILSLSVSSSEVAGEPDIAITEDMPQETEAFPEDTEEPLEPEVENKDVFKIYISGIDCSGKVTNKSRSDVNILATVNVKTGQVLLISTPRDYYVPLSISNGIPDKLTHAGLYGIDCSVDTLSMLYDTKIDYYFRLNFDGFKSIIKALGGITVYSQYEFDAGGYHFVKGNNNLDENSALAFARERHAFNYQGDRQRGRNQMAVVKAVISKVTTSTSILKNFSGFMDGLKQTFETNMPYDKIAELVQSQIENRTKWNIVSYSTDGTGKMLKPFSLKSKKYCLVPDYKTVRTAKILIRQVLKDEVPKP